MILILDITLLLIYDLFDNSDYQLIQIFRKIKLIINFSQNINIKRINLVPEKISQ